MARPLGSKPGEGRPDLLVSKFPENGAGIIGKLTAPPLLQRESTENPTSRAVRRRGVYPRLSDHFREDFSSFGGTVGFSDTWRCDFGSEVPVKHDFAITAIPTKSKQDPLNAD